MFNHPGDMWKVDSERSEFPSPSSAQPSDSMACLEENDRAVFPIDAWFGTNVGGVYLLFKRVLHGTSRLEKGDITGLTREVHELKMQLLQHADCNCTLIQRNYVSASATTFSPFMKPSSPRCGPCHHRPFTIDHVVREGHHSRRTGFGSRRHLRCFSPSRLDAGSETASVSVGRLVHLEHTRSGTGNRSLHSLIKIPICISSSPNQL
ncbi:hypothetical protein EDB81DRAFT_823960, partial [Dactylonectria macrodidyma]